MDATISRSHLRVVPDPEPVAAPSLEGEAAGSPRRSRTILGVQVDGATLRAVGLAFILTRVMVFGIILISSVTIPMRAADGLQFSNPTNLVLDGLVRHDSWWYNNIASTGYTMGDVETHVQGNTAFFPLYPLATRLFAPLFGGIFMSGIILSNLAFLAGLFFVYALARHEFDEASAGRAVFYLAVAPGTVFFSAMYTESFFLLFVAAGFYYARTSRWTAAAIAAALGSATRNTGVAMAMVVLLEGYRQAGFRWRLPLPAHRWEAHLREQVAVVRANKLPVLAAAMSASGLFAYMAYLGVSFGDPLGFIHVQATWGRDVSGGGVFSLVGNTIKSLHFGSNLLGGQLNPDTLLNVFAVLGGFGLVLATMRRLKVVSSLGSGSSKKARSSATSMIWALSSSAVPSGI